eukprot:7338673-Prymnesium_polylepis.2
MKEIWGPRQRNSPQRQAGAQNSASEGAGVFEYRDLPCWLVADGTKAAKFRTETGNADTRHTAHRYAQRKP